MKTDIDEIITTGTTHCEREFACLQNDANICCKVKQYFGNRYLFINCLDSKYCSYKTTFEFSSTRCVCPTRIEIYKKYGL